MKTISGTVVSSNPTTLFAAAKVLSKFRHTENGASRDVAAYLLRASESFDELVRLHRGLESSESDRKRRKHRLSDVGSRIEDGPAAEAHASGGGDGEETEPGREKRRKRKRKEMNRDIATELSEVEQRIDGEKKKRKRKKSDEAEQEREKLN